MLTLYKFLKFLFRHILPDRWRYPLVRWIARGVFALNPARRRTILSNLTPLLGAVGAKRLGPILLGNFLMTAVDFFCEREGLPKSVECETWGILDRAWRKNRRVMIVTAHHGHWELGISCLVERGYAVAGVYAPYREDKVVQWIMKHRNPEAEWIPTTRGAAEACISALERGRLLGMVIDIPFGEKGRRVYLADTPAHLPLGPWAIAVRAKATVIPAFMIRQSPGRYHLTFHEPIVPTEGSFRKQMEYMQDIYVGHLEKILRKYPEQWGVLSPFWDQQYHAE